jgi:hypothetical protein
MIEESVSIEIDKADWDDLCKRQGSLERLVARWGGIFGVLGTLGLLGIGYLVTGVSALVKSSNDANLNIALHEQALKNLASGEHYTSKDAAAADTQLEQRIRDWVESHFQRVK